MNYEKVDLVITVSGEPDVERLIDVIREFLTSFLYFKMPGESPLQIGTITISIGDFTELMLVDHKEE